MARRRVAVIGAGPSGLCTLRNFANFPDEFELTAYDKNRDVGGLWNYSDETDIDEYGLPCNSSMYKTLRSNLPKDLMAFPGFGLPPGLPSFVGYKDVKEYLSNFADHFDVWKFVKFQTYVTEVKPEISGDNPNVWCVTTRDLNTGDVKITRFDVVVICNGKEALPLFPDIPGEKTFKGEILHSKNFRDPQKYKGQVVIIMGAFMSGGDLIFEISPLVPKLYISHRDEPLGYKLPKNVEDVPCIQEVTPDGVILQNGRHIDVDVIIYATGYHYNLPFLAPKCGLTLEGDRIQPLYRHIINIRYPTMGIVGLLKHILDFQVIHRQSMFFIASLRNTFELPSEEDMLADEEADYQKRIVAKNLPDIKAHDLFDSSLGVVPQWEYLSKITQEGKISNISPAIKKLTEHILGLYLKNFDSLRDRSLHLTGNDDFEEELLQVKSAD